MKLLSLAGASLLLVSPAAAQAPDQAADDYNRRVTPEVLVVRAAAPAVVYIETDVRQLVRGFFGTQEQMGQASGSGAVIFDEGYIVTNYHVVNGAEAIRVSFDKSYDPKVYKARLISFVAEEDLALLKIEGEKPFPTLPMGTSKDLMIGERVVAIGNPYGQNNTVSTGIISGLHREVRISNTLAFSNLIQTDASINKGNSGGPLLNINGRLIGINAAMQENAENIGFAIPVDRVIEVLEQHLLSTSNYLAWTGFDVDEATLSVNHIVAGSPAAIAGIEVGDKIVSLGRQDMSDTTNYQLARLSVDPSEQLQLQVRRNGRTLEKDLAPWSFVNGMLYERMGITVESLAMRYSNRLVRVTHIRKDSPAGRLGIGIGDIIETVQAQGRQPMGTPDADRLAIVVQGMAVGAKLKLNLWRDSNSNGQLERTTNPPYSELFQGTLTLE
ncbi:MAG: trypsin-like peptidase domain-containing protein [Planctomycetota bacterium]|nr:trypsin-like peptidase domain-containing protein [Planctomycetota bacterium]MDG2144637.1 trypsin-like peptidase domain-containing protein [Planctomycetota bacterium]